jgi:hypothetical protein
MEPATAACRIGSIGRKRCHALPMARDSGEVEAGRYLAGSFSTSCPAGLA